MLIAVDGRIITEISQTCMSSPCSATVSTRRDSTSQRSLQVSDTRKARNTCTQHQHQKHALVSARLKKPQLDPADTNSYRTISQLSFASKLVERAVATRFVQHCTQNSLLPVRQSAYRRHFSTETALLIVHNDIVRAVDRGDLVPLVLLDLSAAFDTVDHGCLLSILERRFCVDGDALEWFKSYLFDRSQTYISGEDSYGPVSRPNLPRCDCIYCRIIITIMHRVGGPKETWYYCIKSKICSL